MTTERRGWTRDELLVAFNLYCRTPFGRLDRKNPDVIALANGIGRTPSALAMKLCNFASLDPAHKARQIKGLSNASDADRAIFQEFDADWQRLAADSEAARSRLHLDAPGPTESVAKSPAGPTEVIRSAKARRVQGLFRATVLASYDFACAMSGINVPELLTAGHIVPWSLDQKRRMDPRNGIALSALHDRAFDRGLISLDNNLRVVVSGRLRVGKPTAIHSVALLALEGKPIRLPSRYAPDPEALEFHRRRVFIG